MDALSSIASPNPSQQPTGAVGGLASTDETEPSRHQLHVNTAPLMAPSRTATFTTNTNTGVNDNGTGHGFLLPAQSVSPQSKSPATAVGTFSGTVSVTEDAATWQRRMQKVETASSKRTSFIARVGSTTPRGKLGVAPLTGTNAVESRKGLGLVRSHSFSAATIAASATNNGAGAGSVPAGTIFYNTGVGLASPSVMARNNPVSSANRRAHHRSMSNVVDWTPYSKRKNLLKSPAIVSHTSAAAQLSSTSLMQESEKSILKGHPSMIKPNTVTVVNTNRSSAAHTHAHGQAASENGMKTNALAFLSSLSLLSRVHHAIAEHRHRFHHIYHFLHRITDSKLYLFFTIVLTLLSLYITDFNQAFLPASCDNGISGLIMFIYCFYLVEIIVNCVLKLRYVFSFYFWLDLIGTFSLLLDINFINEYNLSNHSNSFNQSTQLLKLTRIIRIIRIMQVIRMVKLLQLSSVIKHSVIANKSDSDTANDGGGDGNSGAGGGGGGTTSRTKATDPGTASAVGHQLSELIDKRVIIIILGMMIILPFFTVENVNYGTSQQMGLNILETQLNTPAVSTSAADLDDYVLKYQNYHSNLIYLSLHCAGNNTDTVYVDLLDSNSGLRQASYDRYLTSSTKSLAVFNIQYQYYFMATTNMLLTTIIIVLFLLGMLVIGRDVHSLVVAPLQRMTQIIEKLAGTICFLSEDPNAHETSKSSNNPGGNPHHSSNDSFYNDDEEDNWNRTRRDSFDSNNGSETRVIEDIIGKLATIFQVEPSVDPIITSGAMSGKGSNKAMAMMAGSKHTEITTLNSVLSIQVVERPRISNENEMEAEFNTATPTNAIIGVTDDELSASPELQSIENGLANAAVLAHFRFYLTSNLLMENLLFYQEVARFQYIVSSHCASLYDHFISNGSSQQVNISATLHSKVKSLTTFPFASMFDEAQNECTNLMKAHVRGFADSKFAQLYLVKRMRHGGHADTVMYKKKRGNGSVTQLPRPPTSTATSASSTSIAPISAATDGGGSRSKRPSLMTAAKDIAMKIEEVEEHDSEDRHTRTGASTGADTDTKPAEMHRKQSINQLKTSLASNNSSSSHASSLNGKSSPRRDTPSSRRASGANNTITIKPSPRTVLPPTNANNPIVAIAMKSSGRKSLVSPKNMNVAAMNAKTLEAEIAALTHPGSEAEKLFNPNKNKGSVSGTQFQQPRNSIHTSAPAMSADQVPVSPTYATSPTSAASATEAMPLMQPEAEPEPEGEVEVAPPVLPAELAIDAAPSTPSATATAATEAMTVSLLEDKPVLRSPQSISAMDDDVEEEMARMLEVEQQ